MVCHSGQLDSHYPDEYLLPADKMTVWLITGCSQESGFGFQIALAALQNGHKVIATSRDPSKSPDLVSQVERLEGKWMALDVTSPNISKPIRQASEIFGSIDILVNNAGYAAIGTIEDVR